MRYAALLGTTLALGMVHLVQLPESRVLNIDPTNHTLTVKPSKSGKILLIRITPETRVFDEHYRPARDLLVGDVISGVLRPKQEGVYPAVTLFVRLSAPSTFMIINLRHQLPSASRGNVFTADVPK